MFGKRLFVLCGILGIAGMLCGCSLLKKQENPEPLDVTTVVSKPVPPEKAQEIMSDAGENFIYGEGLGDAVATAGTVVLFPPYAILLLGNAALSLNGYQSVWLSDALPEDGRAGWRELYGGVTSAPGRVNAALAGEEYRTEERAKEIMEKHLKELNTPEGRASGAATFYPE
ncbi:MAG: hypothetical protein K1X83_12705 [Oligoflexia bacterium]|nr:hypothetical protein [Oligoflexia bacterium]